MTAPFKKLLDPDFSVAGIQDIIGDVSPVVREVVNHATWAWQRCHTEKSSYGGIDEDLAPLTLYRQIIEATDAIDVLLRRSCVDPCVMLLRNSLEAWLSLEYIFESDFSRRSLSWLCEYNHNRLRAYRLADRSCPAGKDFERALKKEFGGKNTMDQREVKEAIKNLESIFRAPHMVPILQEYRSKKRRPRWFSMFRGPGNLRDLAEQLGYAVLYDVFYRTWSGVTHATDLSGNLSTLSTGEAAFKSIRYPEALPQRGLDAIHLLTHATKAMLDHYRSGEEESFGRWHTEKVLPEAQKLRRLKIKSNVVEER